MSKASTLAHLATSRTTNQESSNRCCSCGSKSVGGTAKIAVLVQKMGFLFFVRNILRSYVSSRLQDRRRPTTPKVDC